MLLFERAKRPILAEGDDQLHFFVRYLRRKYERGLAIIYSVEKKKQRSRHDWSHTITLTFDEHALQGSRILLHEQSFQNAPCISHATGVLQANDLGLSLQPFPADSKLTALAICCDATYESPLWRDVQAAAQLQLGDEQWQLITAQTTPVRYKPANRCVLRYTLTLESPEKKTVEQLTLFGKLYVNKQQAYEVQAVQQALYQEAIQRSISPPFLPRPLYIDRELGITFNEAIQTTHAGELLRTGLQALRPQIVRRAHGRDVVVPVDELRLAALALARLHTSAVRPYKSSPRTGAKEAVRVYERTQRIAEAHSEQAKEIHALAFQLMLRLEADAPDSYRPAHGGFKASQLLFRGHNVYVVDFDGFCLADAALDVGYFLAYLRPSALWYRRAGMRKWFEDAAEVFISTYRQAMWNLMEEQTEVDGIVRRPKLYEAALLFKIATRRVNRLNSPRPQELCAILAEIAMCLVHEAGGN
jgi:hypothetical protein